MWAFIPTLILSTLYPLLVEARQRDPVKYNEKLQMVFDVITGIGYAVALGATLLAHWGIPLIYGADFNAAVPILMIQAWSAPVIYNGSVRAQYFLLENLTIYHTVSILLGLATNITLSIFLLARFGLAGAAFGALAGYWVSGYFSCFLFSELRPCARLQTRSFLLPFRLPSLVRSYLAPS